MLTETYMYVHDIATTPFILHEIIALTVMITVYID